jgi:hypothetical protein
MAKYYFDLGVDGNMVRDFTGVDLASVDQIPKYAQQVMMETLMLESPGVGISSLELSVRSQPGKRVFSASLKYEGQRGG